MNRVLQFTKKINGSCNTRALPFQRDPCRPAEWGTWEGEGLDGLARNHSVALIGQRANEVAVFLWLHGEMSKRQKMNCTV